ncbi:MAG: DUF2225 domain-containing protein [Clostridiaceae bacterium]|nr:DUF2225 domain-containing protein [Clostridiaceae bacterium]
MEHLLYDKEINCPCCKNKFNTKKVRGRKLKVLERQTDYYVKYQDLNPIYYHVWICPKCGYSATEGEYVELNKDQIHIVKEKISNKWKQQDYGTIRTQQEAEASYKLAILTGQLLKKPKGYLGGLSLKLAWIYREMKDEREMEFLNYALDFFETSYQQEPLPVAGLDEVSLAYLIGELKRRLDDPETAIKWFAKALDHPEIKRKRQIQLMAREQWQEARAIYSKRKKSEANG